MLVSRSTRLAQACHSALFPATFARTFSRKATEKTNDEKINYNRLSFQDAPDPEHVAYKRVTANDLESCTEPPRRVRMLVRDFIEDSLYHPNYGYFSKQVNIFPAPEPVDLTTVRNTAEFEAEVAKRYASYGEDGDGPGKQLWHTPTELLKVSCVSCSANSELMAQVGSLGTAGP